MSKVELQDILRQYGGEFLDAYPLGADKLKVYNSILHCRTEVFGSHTNTCDKCGYQESSYNSCRNRHCPKCQTFAKEQWIIKQEQSLLDIGYFHVVFTLPSELNHVLYQNQSVLYKLFFKAVSETLLELCMNPKYLGAVPGITAVLHTWGQNLMFHPHIHCIVSGGGLAANNKWVESRKKFFIPVKVLSKKFRGKFMAYFREASVQFHGSISKLNDPVFFRSFVENLYRLDWVTYCKPPFENAAKVIRYLGRYTHRVAISNNRIISADNGYVTFKWRDYSDKNIVKTMTVTAVEFIRRFFLHVLPHGFRKIRHYGILSARYKTDRISLCKKLTNTPFFADAALSVLELLQNRLGIDFNLCPRCGVGHLIRASPL
jgi:hypothetical protein